MEQRTITEGQLADWARSLADAERSAATREKYLREAGAFARWLDKRKLTKESTTAWKRHLTDAGRSPAGINAALSALNGLLDFMGCSECRVRFLKVQRRIFREPERELDKTEYDLLVPLALGTACAVLAPVSAGLLALGVTAALFLPGACLDRYRARTGRAAPEWLRCAGFVLLAAALVAVFFLPEAHGTVYELQRVLHGELSDEFGSHRILIWRRVLEVVKQHPLLGVGPDSLRYYLDIRFERYSDLLGETLVTSVDYAHSEYLHLLVSFGLLGVLPLLALAGLTVTRAVRAGDALTDRLFVPCLFCYAIEALFNVSFCILTPLVCILWGLALARCDTDAGA